MRKSRQKIKKQGCLRVSQGKNQKNGLAGKIAGLKIKKMARRKIPQPQINLKWGVGKFRSPKST